MKKSLSILLTGVSSGIGAAVARRLISEGHTVYGIDIKPSDDKSVIFLEGSITDGARLDEIKCELEGLGVRFDAILNIAGIHRMASLVESDFEEIRSVIDVNLVGTMQVCRVFHPLLADDGRIIIVSSEVASIDPLPFNGIYSVSKTALDSYAQALRQELNLLGQRVITIRPGAIETPLQGGSIEATEKLAESTRLYANEAKKFSAIAKAFMGKPMPADELARLICKATVTKSPRLIYNKHRNPGLILLGILPKSMQLGIIKLLLK